jgi:hypothetical protein
MSLQSVAALGSPPLYDLVCFLGSHTSKWPVGGIYSLPHTSSRWTESSSFLSTGAPDMAMFTVRCLPRLSSVGSDRYHPSATWHTRQSGGAPDSLVWLDDRWLVWRGRRWLRDWPLVRCAAGASDSPVIYIRSAPNCFPRAACSPRASLGTRHCNTLNL